MLKSEIVERPAKVPAKTVGRIRINNSEWNRRILEHRRHGFMAHIWDALENTNNTVCGKRTGGLACIAWWTSKNEVPLIGKDSIQKREIRQLPDYDLNVSPTSSISLFLRRTKLNKLPVILISQIIRAQPCLGICIPAISRSITGDMCPISSLFLLNVLVHASKATAHLGMLFPDTRTDAAKEHHHCVPSTISWMRL